MNEWVYAGFDVTYKKLGVDFDKIYYESDTYSVGREEVLRGLELGVFERNDDGSVWANLENEGLDKKILLRSDGTSVYMTQDIGTRKLRYEEFPIDHMVYVVGNEQYITFRYYQSFSISLVTNGGKASTFSYGMVDFARKMKSAKDRS
jgi:arginyl-tRNA synthetase